ncbi:hypothetical protein DTL42_22065 [Bremerella cremea]|uniref:Uncharacterized protein n=1 Tax=Bremerella cremea TaxID=1031537 RepID=A0A368KKF7_9BACT|nr:hypothetical protein [Bremerella cremea]RCS41256.1 hypothetical protein DTL42_22065 [Bremerella cremea]
MSTDAPSTLKPAESRPTPSGGQDFIRRKINSTRRSVKLAELAAGLLLFAAGSLLFLLTLALIDHWVIGLGFWARLAAFLVYVGAAVAFLWIYVVPLLFHSINPLYAARIIEQGQPTLKNSLLNFLFLSQNQQGTRKAVLDAVETQAASDVSSLKLEHLVDYTKAIRIGYVLAALAILFGLYKVLSPKDPLQTVARVLLPWQEIARPSRVKIEDVKPGSTSIYQGESLEITAKIYDFASSDKLNVVYSTKDGQLVDQTMPLEVGDDGFSFRTLLKTSESGIQQDLTYRIEAGDAVTRDYDVITLEAPSIDIASLRYDFPAYTREPGREQEGDGHIRAIEGTMVTLRAVANRPIQKAYIEFDPIEGGPVVTLNTIPMKVDTEAPNKAWVRFPLELNQAGTTGKFRSYQVRFRTEDGVMNPHPVLYHIDVQRDLPPEVEWIEPRAFEVEVPANQSLRTKLRAIDPDFGIRQIRVVAKQNGKSLFNEAILSEPKTGQAMEAWDFVPTKHGLAEGDVVKLVGVTEDTRTDFDGKLKPNTAETRPLTVRIVAPVKGAGQDNSQPGQANENNAEGGNNAEGEKNSDQQADNSGSQGKQDQAGDKGEMSEEDPKSEGGEDAKGEDGSQSNSGQDGVKGKNDQPQEGENDSQSQEESGKGSTGSAKPQDGEQQQDQQQQPGEGADSQEGNQEGEPQDGQSQMGEGGSSGSEQQEDGQESQSKGSGGQGGKGSTSSDDQNRAQNQSDQAGSPSGKGNGKPGDPNKSGELQKGDASTQPNENSTVERKPDPIASDGSQDGDAFEQLQEYLKEKQQQQNAGGQKPGAEPQANPEQTNQDGDSPQNASQTNGGEPNGEQRPSDQAKQDNAGKGSENQNMGQPDQKNQGSGKSESEDGSNGQQDGMKPDGTGVDNGTKPEKSADGQNATDQEKQDGQPGTKDNNEGEAAERNTQNNEEGSGKNKGGAVNKDTDTKLSNESERPGDKGVGDNGDSGAGNEGNEGDKGSPESSADRSNKQRKNDTHSEDGKKGEQGETAKSPSNSNKQSQSKGDQQGDESGGGGPGGGQPAKQAGNDSAGSTSAGDEGAGVANQQGMGETGQEGGDGPQAEQQTGSSGKEQGQGSQTSQAPGGEKPGENGASSKEGPQDSQQQKSDPKQNGSGPGNSAIPQGGGLEAGNSTPNYDGPIVEPGEDAANLEYAKKATDMVLDKLKHQEGSPDQEMLDKLGWTKDDFQRFMQRWQKMKQAANSSDTGAKRKLNEALQSLGLSRGADTTRRVQSREATAGGSGDTQRTMPPPAFLEQYRAYLKGASQ